MAKPPGHPSVKSVRIKRVGYRNVVTACVLDMTEPMFSKLPDDGRLSMIETRRTTFDGTAVERGG
jgi:hypothetical protein